MLIIGLTGSSGFIGSRLYSNLLRSNKDIDLSLINTRQIDSENKNLDILILTCSPTPLNTNQEVFEEVALNHQNIILDLCKKSKPKKIIYLSSVAIYDAIQEEVIDIRTPYKSNSKYGQYKIV